MTRTAPVNILLVDDRPANLRALEAVLEGLGHNLVKARSGEEALKCLLINDFAVVLLDVLMPGLDGFQTAAMIRERERSKRVPIIFITALDRSEADLVRGYSLGAVDFIYKPLEPEILRSKVNVFVQLFLKSEEARQQVEQLRARDRVEYEKTLTETQERLATQLILREKEKEHERLRFFAISLDMLCIANFERIIQQVNPAFQKILGQASEQLTGKSLVDLIHWEDRATATAELSRLASGTSEIGFESRCVSSDGSIRWISWKATAFTEEKLMYLVGRDVTDQKGAIAALMESEERYRDLFESANDLIQIASPEGRLLFVNRAWREAMGYSSGEAGRLTIFELVHPDYRAEFSQLFQGTLARSGSAKLETVFITKAGKELRVEGASSCRFSLGRPVGWRGMFRDVTQRRWVERMKSEFISTVSHELRTPLASIQGALGLMGGGALGVLSPRIREMVEIAGKNSKQLCHLIDDLLDMEKIESGKLTFNMARVELNSLIRQAIQSSRMYAEQLNVRLQLKNSGAPAWVRADADRVVQVMMNLLSNGAKFSPSGSVVSVSVLNSGDSFRVEVEDHGPGIPEEFRPRIFEKFAQADSSDARQKGGTGLGLSIARSLIRGMGGEIGFTSVPTRGSTFYFHLPKIHRKQRRPEDRKTRRERSIPSKG